MRCNDWLPMRIWLPIVLLLALPSPAAALRVTGEGPRAGGAVDLLRKALARAGVKRATVKVRMRRRPGAWQVTVTVYKTGSARPVLVRVLRAHHGQLKANAAMGLARAAAKALRIRTRRPRRVTRRRPRRRVRAARRVPKPVVVRDEPLAKPAPVAAAPAPAAPAPAPTPTTVAAVPRPAPPKSAAADLGFEVPSARRDPPAHRDPDPPARRAVSRLETPRRVARAHGDDRDDPPTPRARLRARSDDDDDDDAPRRSRRAYVASYVDPLLEFDVGLALAWKNHSLTESDTATNYRSGVHSQFQMTMELLPFRLTNVRALHWLGLRLGFGHSAGLSTATSTGQEIGTSVNCYWGGLVARLPRWRGPFAPQFSLHFGLALNDFSLLEQTDLKDFMVSELAVGGAVLVPLHKLARLRFAAEYRALVGASSDQLASHRVSVGSAQGFRMHAELRGRIIFGLGYSANFAFERIRGLLEPLGSGGSQLELVDSLMTVGVALTYEI